MTRLRLGLAASLLVVCAAVGGAQQRTRCELVQQPTTRASGMAAPGGGQNVFAGGGVKVVCPSRSITLLADSAELYSNDRVFLLGHVRYDEPRLHLDSDFLTYFLAEERLFAYQNVRARLPSGSTMQGPSAEYLRAVPRVRTRARMTATGRPTFQIVERDSAGRPQPPVTVLANVVLMDGDSLIYGSGDVVIRRPELSARSDSAFIDSGRETMRLIGNPRVNGTRGRPFTLTGRIIDSFSRNRKLQRVIARASAVATSEDLNLRADTIDLRVMDDLLERAVAWGPSRARAVSPSQNLIADSIDVRMPGQRVREVHAVRSAYAEGKPDSTRFTADTTDWMRGDTIVALFDSTALRDTTKAPPIRQLVSTGHASAYYHVAAQDSTERRPAITYVTGRQIAIAFDSSRVSSVVVRQQTHGIYVEPTSDTTAAARPRTPAAPRTRPRP
jgi:hypothetical protein